MIKFLKNLWLRLISPKSNNEDLRRQELILNILLLFSLSGFIFLNIIRIIDTLNHQHDRGLPLIYTIAIMLFFIFLFWLSKKGRIKIAAWLLLIIYSLPMFYSFITWGTDLPAALLLAILLITLSGILINANLVLISTAALSLFLIVLTYLQSEGIVAVNRYWLAEKYELGDAIAHAILFLIIASVAWLFCLEIGRALTRARKSEAELREERDSLEIKVIQRTEQLRQAEAEKIDQLYRLAEFGRLSSGIFHDLLNPLTAVSLNLEQIKDETTNRVLSAKSYLNQALLATHKMESLIAGIKKQIQRESNLTMFLINEEIEQIIQILSYKALRAKVKIDFSADKEIKFYGDPVKLGQIATNLLANAIEASEKNNLEESGEEETEVKIIRINLEQDDKSVTLTVGDQGAGIAPENIARIFGPFFSTKKETGRGLGLGLASTKNIIEKNFNGTIAVSSQLGQGSLFTVTFPLDPSFNK